MFGTPTIVLRKNLSEFTTDGKEVVAIDDNNSFVEIEAALQRILLEFDSFSGNARKRFIDSFYYRTYNERVKEILDSLTN
jgi:glycosyltransferase involved in cell wall biosynthesis